MGVPEEDLAVDQGQLASQLHAGGRWAQKLEAASRQCPGAKGIDRGLNEPVPLRMAGQRGPHK